MSEMSIEPAEDDADHPEVILAFDFAAGELSAQALCRDDSPRQDSLAVVLASYIASNVESLVAQAQEAKAQSEAPPPERDESGADLLRLITGRPWRSVTTVAGGLAKGEPKILGADGQPLP